MNSRPCGESGYPRPIRADHGRSCPQGAPRDREAKQARALELSKARSSVSGAKVFVLFRGDGANLGENDRPIDMNVAHLNQV